MKNHYTFHCLDMISSKITSIYFNATTMRKAPWLLNYRSLRNFCVSSRTGVCFNDTVKAFNLNSLPLGGRQARPFRVITPRI